MQINREAVDDFLAQSEESEKYAKAPLDNSSKYWGREISSARWWAEDTTTAEKFYNFQNWVVQGGYDADEPEVRASLNHFYDPVHGVGLQMERDWLLMPESWRNYYMQQVKSTNKTAKSWGLTDASNPFCYVNGLKYYKQSMEVKEMLNHEVLPFDDSHSFNKELQLSKSDAVTRTDLSKIQDLKDPSLIIPGADVREGGQKKCANTKEYREWYLSKAFRSLGETMHLMGDMTQPAHVRNDAHGWSDPLEDSLTPDIVMDKANSKLVNVGMPDDPEKLFHSVALFVNQHFLTADTIYGSFFDVPRIDKLTIVKGNILFDVIDEVQVPIAERTLSTWIYGVEEGSNVEDYTISSVITRAQATILVPIAISATKKLADEFFPTLVLNMGYDAVEVPAAGVEMINAYKVWAEMKHLVAKDLAWQKYGLKINYCGPGRLMKVSGSQESELADLYFENGRIMGFRTEKSKLYQQKEPIIANGANPKNTDYLLANDGDKIYVMIEAGGRIFKTDPVTLNFYELKFDSQQYKGQVGKSMILTASMNKTPDNMIMHWNFGDGKKVTGSSLQASHVYNKPGTYKVTLELFENGMTSPVAKDSTEVIISEELVKPAAKKPTQPEEPTSRPEVKKNPPENKESPSKPKPTAPPAKEYDYNAAMAKWAAAYAAKENAKYWDEPQCTTTCTFEWVVAPYIKGGSVYGASRLTYHEKYKDGRVPATKDYIASEMYDAANPGAFISLGDLRRLYPNP